MAIERTNSNVWVEDRLQKQSVFPLKSVLQGPQPAQQAFPASSSREQEQKLTRLETLAKQAKGARVSFPGSSKSHTLFSPPPPRPSLQAPGLFIMIIIMMMMMIIIIIRVIIGIHSNIRTHTSDIRLVTYRCKYSFITIFNKFSKCNSIYRQVV